VTFTCPKEMMVRSAESTLLSAVLTCLLLSNDKSFRRMCFNIASLNVMRHTALQNAATATPSSRRRPLRYSPTDHPSYLTLNPSPYLSPSLSSSFVLSHLIHYPPSIFGHHIDTILCPCLSLTGVAAPVPDYEGSEQPRKQHTCHNTALGEPHTAFTG
jgi:hypothetical protein